ncbi:uracil phosphoribosyltransferase [Decorospora gaudefroyi]|uniref:Uracil phosphoribosyltransferase n=1 Tax=Decorospora gaudefroyi TaxID=184978 RepID=A0A6A5KEQ7_9PLEO|nr:uracil phosphoribosyltransferase [Decorospora gaudefroyi]
MTDSENMTTPRSSKPLIIGLYGISGCGKSHTSEGLKTRFPSDKFNFYDGSALIDQVVAGGLTEFKKGSVSQKTAHRIESISKASEDCQKANKIGVITGHYMFWQNEDHAYRIGTEKDWMTYTHIIYLNVDVELIARRRQEDEGRGRNELAIEHLRKWQKTELKELRAICLERKILFSTVTETKSMTGDSTLERVATLLNDFQHHDETANDSLVMRALNSALPNRPELETVLVLDADKTLAPQDTGSLFWQEYNLAGGASSDCPLKELFTKQKYSYASFRQVMLLYEETGEDFDSISDKVAAKAEMYPEMIALLKRVATAPHVGAVIVTCGLRHLWESVLRRYNLSHISVIGGGRLQDGYVVTGDTKGDIVHRLHEKRLRVVAFGDSPLDIKMFQKADEAYVVVGDKGSRSKSMDEVLANEIHEWGLVALQVALPSTSGHRLDLETLPKAKLDSAELDFIFRQRSTARFMHASGKNAAKLLMTPTRNAAYRSHSLRKAHGRVGYYLSMEFLSEIIGLEEIEIQHVQEKLTDGYRFRHEKATLIIPLMRGGEPMAFGVSKAMPAASFAHAKKFRDIEPQNFHGKRTVILVDSVVNSGQSIVEFVEPLRRRYPQIRIIVVAGVVQADAVVIRDGGRADGVDNRFAELLRDDGDFFLVALRKSDNRFKGQGVTDTGHRLFNTTNLD